MSEVATFYLTADVQICKPEDSELGRIELENIRRLSLEEAGCTMFEICQDREDPCRFIVWGRFTDEAAFDWHYAQPYVQDWFSSEISKTNYLSKVNRLVA